LNLLCNAQYSVRLAKTSWYTLNLDFVVHYYASMARQLGCLASDMPSIFLQDKVVMT
jgi:hypothetical protein